MKWKVPHRYIILLIILLAGLRYYLSLPDPLFKDPCSTVINDRNGILMGARIADDGQWRFPAMDSVPGRFRDCILQFEDRKFYSHPGFRPGSLFRALYQDIRAGRIVSGGSTLTMQVVRLSRRNPSRTVLEKIKEIILSTRIELAYSKDEILSLYCSNAPFGGNVVGLQAASWRYFGRAPSELSWAESATLAVLPNAPALIHPGRNRDLLRKKRDWLLDRLLEAGKIDSMSCMLAKLEALPDKPHSMPDYAPHLLEYFVKMTKGREYKTTIDLGLQKQVAAIVDRHHKILASNGVNNAAVIIIDVETGNVLAYIANTTEQDTVQHENQVDIIQAPRSTGSILKPLLFAAMLDAGEILPGTLVADIPTFIAGYSPKNFTDHYDGAVPAKRALERSLNVPAVRMLQQYGYPRFHHFLKDLGLTSINQPADHYGLSLILGGAEGKLFEISGVYASFARILDHFAAHSGKYDAGDLHMPQLMEKKETIKNEGKKFQDAGLVSAAAIYETFEALRQVNRPEEMAGWESFSSSRKVAWKTGTSFGFRDAWAVGTTPVYTVGVWAGNADGEGRPGLTGINAAAPLLFDAFNLLPPTGWFSQPYDEMIQAAVCHQSGYRASQFCDEVDTSWIPLSCSGSPPCPYHHLVFLDKSEKYRVNSSVFSPDEMIEKSWFTLPPAMEWYYKKGNASYKALPPWHPAMKGSRESGAMGFIYPQWNARIFIPLEMDGSRGKVVFEAAHRDARATIYWHLDGDYCGSTRNFHQMELSPLPGRHTLTLVDEYGEDISVEFEIIGEENSLMNNTK